jgi:glycosyltransferase involved in cell wall biosynthesis
MRLTACVLYQDNDNLIKWRKTLPIDNVQVVALKTMHDPSLKEPYFEEIGVTTDLVALQWNYNDFESQFDFSYLRNKCDEYANGDWILHMDSDEYLTTPHNDLWAFLEAIDDSEADAGYVTVYGLLNRGKNIRERYSNPNVRLHRTSAKLKWSGICHETLDDSMHKGTWADTEIMLYHEGYLIEQEDFQKKGERNAKLLIREYMRCNSQRNWNYLIKTFSSLQQG